MSTKQQNAPVPVSAELPKRLAEVLEFRRRLSVRDTATAMQISTHRVKQLQAQAVEAIGGETLTDAVALLTERMRAA